MAVGEGHEGTLRDGSPAVGRHPVRQCGVTQTHVARAARGGACCQLRVARAQEPAEPAAVQVLEPAKTW